MVLTAAAALFVVFSFNVALGSFGLPTLLGDVGEMLLLFAASIVFVAAILKREGDEKRRNPKVQGRNQNG